MIKRAFCLRKWSFAIEIRFDNERRYQRSDLSENIAVLEDTSGCSCFPFIKKSLLEKKKKKKEPTSSALSISLLSDKIGCLFSKRRHRTLVDRPDGSSPPKKQQNHKLKTLSKQSKYLKQEEEPRDVLKVSTGRDSEGNKYVNQYVELKTLGTGAYGKVKLCVNTEDKQYYAVKVFKKSMLQKRRVGMKKGAAYEDVMREIQLMRRLNHKNVIQLYEVINDPNDDHLFMVLEYAEQGSILKGDPEHFTPLPEVTAKKYFCDILAAIEYIHSLKIIHRDIKPENLLVTQDGTAKLSDFGVSIMVDNDDDEILKKTVGSPAFLPPELCSESSKVLGSALDVWGLGVSLYCFIFGKLPFVGDTESQLYDNIRDHDALIPVKVNPELEDLIRKLMVKDPEKRITVQQIKVHPWVTK